MARFFALAGLVVLAVALADLVANPKGTAVLANAGVTAERTALNAELGKAG